MIAAVLGLGRLMPIIGGLLFSLEGVVGKACSNVKAAH